jgi:transcriptional regulator with XRE-family HTH domain
MSLFIPDMEKIINLREARGASQRDLSKVIGASQTYLSKVENSDRLMRFSLVLKFAAHFEVDVLSLIKEADYSEFEPSSQKAREAYKFTSDYLQWMDTGKDPETYRQEQMEEENKKRLERTIVLDKDLFEDIRQISTIEVRRIEDQIHKVLMEFRDVYFKEHGGSENIRIECRKKRFAAGRFQNK